MANKGVKRLSLKRRLAEKMASDDIAYFERRAEAELELAQKAEHPQAVRAHYHLAAHYLDRIYGESPPADDRSV